MNHSMSVTHTGKVYREGHIPQFLYASSFLLSLRVFCFFFLLFFPRLLPAAAHLPFAMDLFTVAGEEGGGERK